MADNDPVGIVLSYPYVPGTGLPPAGGAGASTAVGRGARLEGAVDEGDPGDGAFVVAGYGVSLRSKPCGDVVVDVSAAHHPADAPWLRGANASGAYRLATPRLVFTAANWNRRQPVRVLVVSDDVARPAPAFVLRFNHSLSSAGDVAFDRPGLSADEPAAVLTVREDAQCGSRTADELTS